MRHRTRVLPFPINTRYNYCSIFLRSTSTLSVYLPTVTNSSATHPCSALVALTSACAVLANVLSSRRQLYLVWAATSDGESSTTTKVLTLVTSDGSSLASYRLRAGRGVGSSSCGGASASITRGGAATASSRGSHQPGSVSTAAGVAPAPASKRLSSFGAEAGGHPDSRRGRKRRAGHGRARGSSNVDSRAASSEVLSPSSAAGAHRAVASASMADSDIRPVLDSTDVVAWRLDGRGAVHNGRGGLLVAGSVIAGGVSGSGSANPGSTHGIKTAPVIQASFENDGAAAAASTQPSSRRVHLHPASRNGGEGQGAERDSSPPVERLHDGRVLTRNRDCLHTFPLKTRAALLSVPNGPCPSRPSCSCRTHKSARKSASHRALRGCREQALSLASRARWRTYLARLVMHRKCGGRRTLVELWECI